MVSPPARIVAKRSAGSPYVCGISSASPSAMSAGLPAPEVDQPAALVETGDREACRRCQRRNGGFDRCDRAALPGQQLGQNTGIGPALDAVDRRIALLGGTQTAHA